MQLVHKEEERVLLWGDVTPGVGWGWGVGKGPKLWSPSSRKCSSFSLTSADLMHVHRRMHVYE